MDKIRAMLTSSEYAELWTTLYLNLFPLTLSVFTVGTVFKLWFEYDARVLAEKIQAEAALAASKAKALAEELKRQAALDAEAARKRQAELEIARQKRASITAQRQRTCNFWKDQYLKTKSSYDKGMRDTACR